MKNQRIGSSSQLPFRFLFCAAFGISVLASLPLAAQTSKSSSKDWNQWRGPQRDGLIEASRPWPESLSEDSLKKVWSVKLGPGYSGPIVNGDQLIVTETVNKESEVVRSLNLETGKEKWRSDWKGAMKVPFFARENGDWIRSTPACNGKLIVVAGMRDVLVCLDAEDGKIKWSVDFVKKYKTPLPSFGFVCSPMIDGEFVYVQAAASFVKLELKSGKVVWRSLIDQGGMNGSAFSSPVIGEFSGRRLAIVQTRTQLAGVDLKTGEALWQKKIPAFRGMNVLTPSLYEGGIFTSAYGGTSSFFQVSSDNSKSQKLDEKWKNAKQGYMCSPVIIDGYAYLHLRNRRFTCIDLRDGSTQWTTKPFGKYWSLIANGKQILALDEKGDLRMIQANPKEFKVTSTRKVGSDSWAHLAVQGDWIFIRNIDAVHAYRWTRK